MQAVYLRKPGREKQRWAPGKGRVRTARDIHLAAVRVSVGHGQKANQLSQDDLELSDMGWRSVHAVAVRTAGSLRMEAFLAASSSTRKNGGRKNGPIAGAKFQRGKVGG